MAKEERKVAEWILFEGGELSIEGDAARIQDVSALPSGDFFIETLDLVGTLIEPPQLERLSGLTRLRNLYLAGPMWNRNADDGKDHSPDLRGIAGITSIERITFSYHFLDRTRFQDGGLAAIQPLARLRELSVRQANVRGHSLGPFHRLQVLDVTLAPVDDEGFRNVAGMPDLERLWAGDTLVTDSGLAALSRLQKLVDLDLHGTQVSDLGLSQIAGLKQLRKINLMGTRVTDDGLEVLRGFPQLEYLNLYRTRVTNAGLDRLKPLSNLREIDLRYTRVSRAGVDSLRSTLAKTSFVFIDSSPVSSSKPVPVLNSKGDAAVAAWVRAMGGAAEMNGASLIGINLATTPLTDARLAGLKGLTRLRKLDISATEVGDLGLQHLAGLTTLTELSLDGSQVSDKGIASLSKLTELRKLILSNTYVEGPGVKNLAGLQRLRELRFTSSPLRDEAVETLLKLPALTHLSLAYTDLTGKGVAQLAGARALTELDLSGVDIDDEGLNAIGSLSNLSALYLRDGRFDDKGIQHLTRLTRLQDLDLFRAHIADVGFRSPRPNHYLASSEHRLRGRHGCGIFARPRARQP